MLSRVAPLHLSAAFASPSPDSAPIARKPATTATRKAPVTQIRYLSMNALIGAQNSRNKMPPSMKEKARLARLAHRQVQKLRWMKEAVIVSSMNGIGVAPLINMISAPSSRQYQAAGGKAAGKPRR